MKVSKKKFNMWETIQYVIEGMGGKNFHSEYYMLGPNDELVHFCISIDGKLVLNSVTKPDKDCVIKFDVARTVGHDFMEKCYNFYYKQCNGTNIEKQIREYLGFKGDEMFFKDTDYYMCHDIDHVVEASMKDRHSLIWGERSNEFCAFPLFLGYHKPNMMHKSFSILVDTQYVINKTDSKGEMKENTIANIKQNDDTPFNELESVRCWLLTKRYGDHDFRPLW